MEVLYSAADADKLMRKHAKQHGEARCRCSGEVTIVCKNGRYRYHHTAWGWTTRTRALALMDGAKLYI